MANKKKATPNQSKNTAKNKAKNKAKSQQAKKAKKGGGEEDPDGHFGSASLDELHDKNVQETTTEGGACLTGHLYDFAEKKNQKTCNYRYQAYEQAKAETRIRNRLHSYERKLPQVHHEDGQLLLFITTSVFKSKKRGLWPACLSVYMPLPRVPDWHLGGPATAILRERIDKKTTDNVIQPGMNFTNMRWPYWNNAHHLISKGRFKATIIGHGAVMSELIQTALLKAKYNINHKLNMLLIPMDKEVAAILGFLRHLQLGHDDAPVRKEKRAHRIYDKMVIGMEKSGLNRIIGNYASILTDVEAQREKDKDHDVPDAELDKKKLERLSAILLDWILDEGAVSQGDSLDATAHALGY
jgi:hypothetical protein